MATLYLVRHGQTLFNRLHRKQGWCDSPLTELGIEQAKTTRDWLRARGIAFDHAYSSTSERACDTLELIVPGMDYERVKGLREWNFGTFEGLTEDTNPPLPYGDFYKPFGGEGEMEFRERLMCTLTQIMERPGHLSVLCATHGAACAQVLRACGHETLRTGEHMGNCCVITLGFDGGDLSAKAIDNPND
ncbi:Phosphoglycerate mutase [Coriobacterium glomerans PW2]|uniref:Phosphoglycerate mutase n=1 Tax=Coriobacterium glomerans (strain ATCC 49209 / DSM 20642 / JCM 10262 / PW2) TaxID=700015 RepID=F2NAT2_CORGP|nr:histidine phosphatase family protein [Coriobacterium glomerans]AEB07538.1 Phosphoglycerate mutase [Coriobacterium glomerans PW2]